MKKAGSGGWKQRYANLEGASLVYYENNFMSAKTQAGEISLSQARVMPCRFAGAAPTPAGMAVATGFVLSSKSSGDFFFMRSDVRKPTRRRSRPKRRRRRRTQRRRRRRPRQKKKGVAVTMTMRRKEGRSRPHRNCSRKLTARRSSPSR